MRFHPFLLVLLLGLTVLLSCEADREETDYIARVYDHYLSRERLVENIPPTASSDDSLKRAKVFVNAWIREKVLLQKAEFNLNKEDPRFQKKVERYLNDLIIYEYEQQLVNEKLDTHVTEAEMLEFYEENKQNFLLKDYVARARYMVAPEDLKGIDRIARRFMEYDESDSLAVAEYVEEHGLYFKDDPENWMVVPQLLEIIPINFTYLEEKVKIKSNFDKSDDGKRYLLYIREFKVKDSESPFELERERIRSIILNSRKSELLEDMRDNLFKEALESGQIEIKE
ncbi:MAG: hypothetical protein HKN79_05450 [Flavobacteriales bacterium]|nr:hypothetical protein [Flavobacteriales bacterium]